MPRRGAAVRRRHVVVTVLAFSFAALLSAQTLPDEERVWKAYICWLRTVQIAPDPEAYAAELWQNGVAEAEINRQVEIVARLSEERTEALAHHFDLVYSDPKAYFNTRPNALLVEATKGLSPGMALDVAMGQGRNAVYLAQLGWDVTGFDISKKGLKAAHANAQKAGVRINTFHASDRTFDFGEDRWDLIVLSYAFVPISDPAFAERVRRSLRRGGLIVYENYFRDPKFPLPRFVGAPEPNTLPGVFSDYQIVRYEEVRDKSDWGPVGSPLVRMVARKQ
jgi:SAM-dependent methyltransferase